MTEMNASSVRITDLTLVPHDDYQELAARVDGERIWFRLPLDLDLVPRPEAFLPLALFEAMARGVPVEIDESFPISAQLHNSMLDIQQILNCWNSELKIVPILASTTDSYPSSDRVACCFSGGIDSSFSYASNRDTITHLLLMQGFVKTQGGPDDWEENIAARQKFADSENKKLITVHTNAMDFLEDRDISILLSHGGVLCGLGAALGLKKLLIPASYTYSNLMPWGSHPMLDPLWSTEAMQIVHHGTAASRIQKTAEVAKHQYLLDQLQVCWFAGGSNCGECGKCVRTSLALHFLGATSRSLPPYRDVVQLKALMPVSEQVYPFLAELAAMAVSANEPAIASRLNRYLQSYRFRQAAREFARELAGVRGRNLLRKLRPRPWHTARGTLNSVKIETPK